MNLPITERDATLVFVNMNTPKNTETKHHHNRQTDTRPKIDDAVCHFLDGDALKDALIFIDRIRDSKMKIKWSSVNEWSVYKGFKHICDIKIAKGKWSVNYVKGPAKSTEDKKQSLVESLVWSIDDKESAITEAQKVYLVA